MTFQTQSKDLAFQLFEKLKISGKKIALAESCTGGLVAKLLTDMPGSSSFFECGIVSYSNRIKSEILGVDESVIDKYTVVSPEVAMEMAKRVRILAGADFGIGITGVAGPGPDGEHPEGEIYVAFANSKNVFVRALNTKTEDEREYNRYFAAINALEMAIECIENNQ